MNYTDIGLTPQLNSVDSLVNKNTEQLKEYVDQKVADISRPGGVDYYQSKTNQSVKAIVSMNPQGGAFTNIQGAVDYVQRQGGGAVYLTAGTYLINTAILLRSGVSIWGESRDKVVITTGTTLGTHPEATSASCPINIMGTQIDFSGSINVGTNTTTINGLNTSWGTSIQQGDRIYFDIFAYTINSVTNGTSLEIQEIHRGESFGSQTYQITRPAIGCSVKNLTIRNSIRGGMFGWYTEDMIIENCCLDSNINADGIFLYQNYNFRIYNTLITNSGTSSTNNGLVIAAPLAPAPAGIGIVDGVIAMSCSGNGFSILTDNTKISNCVSSGNEQVGVDIGGSNITANHCFISGNKSWGVNVSSGANNVKIIGCNFNNQSNLISNGGTNTVIMGNTPNTLDNSYLPNNHAAVFNQDAANIDFRAEGTSDPNLFFLDASTNRIGIGTNTPQATFHSLGSTILGVGTSGISDSNIGSGQVNPYLEESGNLLYFKVKKSNGSILSGSISLT